MKKKEDSDEAENVGKGRKKDGTKDTQINPAATGKPLTHYVVEPNYGGAPVVKLSGAGVTDIDPSTRVTIGNVAGVARIIQDGADKTKDILKHYDTVPKINHNLVTDTLNKLSTISDTMVNSPGVMGSLNLPETSFLVSGAAAAQDAMGRITFPKLPDYLSDPLGSFDTALGRLNRSTVFPEGAATVFRHEKTAEEKMIEKVLERVKEQNTKSKDEKTENLEKRLEAVSEELKILREAGEKARIAQEKTGLAWLEEKMNNGYSLRWHCKGCGGILEIFSGNEGFSKIKNYLQSFQEKTPKACVKNGKDCSVNWFEITENKIAWHGISDLETQVMILKKSK